MKPKEPVPTDWREGRRLRAWELHEQGWKQKAIATALGVTEGAVSQWVNKGKAQGKEALRRHPAPGRQPKLTDEQRAQLPGLLARGAEAYGFRGQIWTTKRVASLIKQAFGVTYHPAHCSRLLRAVRYSVQQPIQHATQRDEKAIQHWKDEEWTALKKRPLMKSAPLSS